MAIKLREFEVRIARTKEEKTKVRQLRWKVFVEEDGKVPSEEEKKLKEEFDSYDAHCDYMIVIHNNPRFKTPRVVATYRIILREHAEKMSGFYTETEYDLKKLKRHRGNIAEMSRACVDIEYRNGLAMKMLWMGLADYILKKKIDLLFGVASFVGQKPVEFAHAISYLYYNHLAPLKFRVPVLPGPFSRMNILPKEYVDEKKALEELTPIMKGYLRLGAEFGKGVFVDYPFNAVDVFVLIETNKVNKNYQKHITGSANAFDHLNKDDGVMKYIYSVLKLPLTGLKVLANAIVEDVDEDEPKDKE